MIASRLPRIGAAGLFQGTPMIGEPGDSMGNWPVLPAGILKSHWKPICVPVGAVSDGSQLSPDSMT